GGAWSELSVDPYFWAVFFKIDGTTVYVDKNLTFQGSPVFSFTAGSHGNLGVRGLRVGGLVNIPDPLGTYAAGLQPILFEPAANLAAINVPAIFGVAAVALIQGHVSDGGAEAGHQAFNASVQVSITQILASLVAGDLIAAQNGMPVLTPAAKQRVASDA